MLDALHVLFELNFGYFFPETEDQDIDRLVVFFQYFFGKTGDELNGWLVQEWVVFFRDGLDALHCCFFDVRWSDAA